MTPPPETGRAERRVLLTGATGFIGSHCIAGLLERGFEVVATYNTRPSQPIDGVQWLQADLLDARTIGPLVDRARASYLLHLAWYVEPGKLINHLDNLAWCSASIELLRRFQATGGERCVMGGSCYEYDWRYGYCNEQLTPCRPDTLYGSAKLGLSEIMLGYCAATGMSGAWGRDVLPLWSEGTSAPARSRGHPFAAEGRTGPVLARAADTRLLPRAGCRRWTGLSA